MSLTSEERAIFCSFRNLRKWIMDETWKRAKLLEQAGVQVSHEVFGQIIKGLWEEARQKSRLCPIVSYEEVKKILEKLEVKPPEVKAEVEVHGEGEASGETSSG